jgi:hypothetical protein
MSATTEAKALDDVVNGAIRWKLGVYNEAYSRADIVRQ